MNLSLKRSIFSKLELGVQKKKKKVQLQAKSLRWLKKTEVNIF